MQWLARRQWRATRIGDAEREQALIALQRHYQDGRLDFHEFEARTHEAAVARTNGDLERIQHDLPALPVRMEVRTDPAIRLYLFVNALIVLWWMGTDREGSFWPIIPIVVWGILLAARGHRWRQQRPLPPGR